MLSAKRLARAKEGRPTRRKITRKQRRARAFYSLISPWMIGFVLLSVVPLVVGFLVSLSNYDGLNIDTVKLHDPLWTNYERAVNDPMAKHSLSRTLLWTALNLPLWLIFSFGLALVLNQKIRGIGIYRTLFYLPSIVPAVAAVWVWKIFLEQNYGLLNGIIGIFRPGTAIPWLSSIAIFGIAMIALWNGFGSGMIIFLAGLQGIPDELVEAARIDGANRWQSFRLITLPMMTPVIFFQLVLGLIGSFQQFVIPQLVTATASRAVTPRSAYLYMIHVYRQFFTDMRFGYGMALLWILIVVIVILTLILFFTERYWVHSEIVES